MMRRVRISGIYVYPIKSCGGVSLAQSDVVERGLAFDRRYMLADRTGRFVTQREKRRLCQVKLAFAGPDLLVTAPGASPLTLSRAPDSAGLEPALYSVWESSGRALRDPEGSRWFSELLNDDVSLLYMPDSEQRAVNPKRARPSDIVSFADGYPLLLISEESLRDLNCRLEHGLEMARFRPNLVIAGGTPYQEDTFGEVRFGTVSCRAVKRCDRCVMTTLDPETGEAGKEPLRTLARYRQEDGRVWFGMNLVHDGPGAVRIGDEVYLQ
ncbi:MAG: uncharacterized protein K0R38_4214 [Polyangiaceae bacterium]|jgi:uncharacterized protein YcbX|nr:uncharacterized protein [Polyangiaceae bacterium]